MRCKLFGSYKDLLQEELDRKQKSLKKLESKVAAQEKTVAELQKKLKHATASYKPYV